MARFSYYVSDKTLEKYEASVDRCVHDAAKTFGLEEAIIRAIIKKESAFVPMAFRYEPHLENASWYKKLLTSDERKSFYSFCSMGHMQPLFGIAKDHGFTGSPQELFFPEYSIHYGAKHFKSLCKRFKLIENAVSAYNQGNDRKTETGEFKNQYYVDKVMKYYKEYGGSI